MCSNVLEKDSLFLESAENKLFTSAERALEIFHSVFTYANNMDRPVSSVTLLILLIANTPFIDAARPSFVTDTIVQLAKPLTDYCKSVTNMTDEDIQKVNNGNFEAGNMIGCYSNCLWGKMDLLDESGNVKTDVIKNLLPEELRETVVQTLLTCQKRFPPSTDDKCARALQIQKCYRDLSPETYYLL